jgi:hypothetical protein
MDGMKEMVLWVGGGELAFWLMGGKRLDGWMSSRRNDFLVGEWAFGLMDG